MNKWLKASIFVLVYWLLATSMLLFAQSTNLLPNNGFESGTTSWVHTQSGTAAVVSNSALAHSGVSYAELTLTGSTTATSDHFTSDDGTGTGAFYLVNQGDILTFGGWAIRISGNGLPKYSLALYDSGRVNIGYVSSPSVTATAWTQAGSTYVVPAGTRFVKFYAQVASGSSTTTARFDDAFLNESPVQSISVTPNPASAGVSEKVQFTATGSYFGGITRDLTTAVVWASSDTSIATISNTSGSQGLATAVSRGASTISATAGSVVGSSTMNVTSATAGTLTSITVTPSYGNISGGTQQFTATGNYSDATTQDITTSVIWSSSNTPVVTISNAAGSQGVASSVGPVGATKISATSGTITGATILNVSGSGNVLANSGFESGSTMWVHSQSGTTAVVNSPANANTGNRYAELVLPGSTLSTSDTLVSADASNHRVFYPVNPGDTLTFGGWANLVSGNGRLVYTLAIYDSSKANPVYVSTPGSAVTSNTWTQVTATYIVPAGRSYVQFYANLTNPTITTTAWFDDPYLFDTPATLTSISVTPNPNSMSAGRTQQYTAIGTYNNGFQQDISTSVSWDSSSPSSATVSNTSGNQGMVNAIAAGTTNITATSGAVMGFASLTVTSAPVLQSLTIAPLYPNISGGTQQFTATGSYNDGTTPDMTGSVNWTSNNSAVATISNSPASPGLATSSGQAGATKISATSGTFTPATILTVSGGGNLLANSSFESGITRWVRGQSGAAVVVNNAANANSGSSYAQLDLTGSATPSSVTLSSATSAGIAAFYPVSQGQILTFGGWANLVNGNGKVTFTLAVYDFTKSNPSFVSTSGATTNTWTQLNSTYTVPAGRSYVKFYAQINNPTTTTSALVDDAYLLISPPVLQSISVTPNPASVVVNNTKQFTATGNYSGALTQDLTTSVGWSSSSSAVATVSNTSGTQGLASGVSAGATSIIATSGSIIGSANLTVTSTPILETISVTPSNPIISSGTQQFTATGSYNDGSTAAITNSVAWSSKYPAVATISNSTGSQGLATSTGQVGTTPIIATSGSISGSTILSVSKPGSLSSIRHIVVLSQENRSFDSYFGQMGKYRNVLGYTDPFDGTPPGVALKTKTGALIAPFHQRTVCHDNLTPAWTSSHEFVHNGLMDKFMLSWIVASTIDPNNTRAMGYYNQNDLPYYYQAATQFATSDRYFSPVLAPTQPNRYYLLTGTSFGHIAPSSSPPSGGYTQPTIFDALTANHVSWRYYYQDISHNDLSAFSTYSRQQSVVISKFFTDIQNEATLPSVLYIDRKGGYDEHPNTNMQQGAANTRTIIDALMQSPAWASSVFILIYDEGGGLYDHVAPPAAVPPDNIPPMLQPSDFVASFNQYGFRVPMIVFSPWVKPHFVSHVVRDHTSILKLIETRFGIGPLTARDAAADDMTEFFDFSVAPAWLTPPSLQAQPTNGACDYNQEIAP